MRKNIIVDESLITKSLVNRKVMNDIMYYLRKLLKLARRAQTSMLREGYDIESDTSVQECLKEVREEIERMEKEWDRS